MSEVNRYPAQVLMGVVTHIDSQTGEHLGDEGCWEGHDVVLVADYDRLRERAEKAEAAARRWWKRSRALLRSGRKMGEYAAAQYDRAEAAERELRGLSETACELTREKAMVERERDDLRRHGERLAEAVEQLKRGRCWCEMAVGNPMVKSHTPKCIHTKEVLANYRKEYGSARRS